MSKKLDVIQFLAFVLFWVLIIVPMVTGLPYKSWEEYTISGFLSLPVGAVWLYKYNQHFGMLEEDDR